MWFLLVSSKLSENETESNDMRKYIPIIVLTSVFGAIFAFGPCFVRKGPNKQIIRVCIMMTAFCLWIFWVTAYISQINPLTGPRLHNTTFTWYQYTFGKTVVKPDDDDDNRIRGGDGNDANDIDEPGGRDLFGPEPDEIETGGPESGRPVSGRPESGRPESGRPESGRPESGRPESGRPESGQPESGRPDSGVPDGRPDSDRPGSAGVVPGGVKPGNGGGKKASGDEAGEAGSGDGSEAGVKKVSIIEEEPPEHPIAPEIYQPDSRRG